MNIAKIISSIAVVSSVLGCATPLSSEKILSADYGAPPPENYDAMVKEFIGARLIDPTAPLYEIGQPAKGFTRESLMFDTKENFGWRVCGTVNSKNRYGGYTGKAPFFTLFKNGQIVEFIIGDAGKSMNSLDNEAIQQACTREVKLPTDSVNAR